MATSFIGKKKQDDSISLMAKEIINLIAQVPELFLPLREIIVDCYDQRYIDDVKIIIDSIDVTGYKTKVDQFKKLILSYYQTDNSKWPMDKRRSYLVEELLAAIEPLKLGINIPQHYKLHREASACQEGRKVYGNYDIDIVLEGERTYDGIECKARLSTWLHANNRMEEEALKKLNYMLNVKLTLEEENWIFQLWLGTFQANITLEKQALDQSGFEYIGLINANKIYDASIKVN